MKAIVFVDVQKDFIDGALRNEKAIEVTPKIVEWTKELMVSNPEYKFYATRDTHTKDYLNTLEGKKLPVEHCVEMTEGWMIDERLYNVLEGNCTFINKPTFGSFDLAEIIDEDIQSGRILDNVAPEKRLEKMYEPLEEIVLCGFCTDICCVSCALLLRAKFPNTKITVMKDLCAGTNTENHEAALKVMKSCQVDIK